MSPSGYYPYTLELSARHLPRLSATTMRLLSVVSQAVAALERNDDKFAFGCQPGVLEGVGKLV